LLERVGPWTSGEALPEADARGPDAALLLAALRPDHFLITFASSRLIRDGRRFGRATL
jgi:hypothetical protein